MSLGVGFVVDGRYAIERSLRQTATRATYLVRHTHIDARYELDVLLGRDEESTRRFRDEAKLLSRFGIRGIGDFGRMDDGSLYIAFEHRPGVLLSELVPVPPPRAAAIVRALASDLAAIHAHGVVAGVLRPDSVLVCDDGSACVVDFTHGRMESDPSVDLHALAVLLVELTGSAKALADALAPVPEVKQPERNPFDF
jgi:serine/threonine protein kinase